MSSFRKFQKDTGGATISVPADFLKKHPPSEDFKTLSNDSAEGVYLIASALDMPMAFNAFCRSTEVTPTDKEQMTPEILNDYVEEKMAFPAILQISWKRADLRAAFELFSVESYNEKLREEASLIQRQLASIENFMTENFYRNYRRVMGEKSSEN